MGGKEREGEGEEKEGKEGKRSVDGGRSYAKYGSSDEFALRHLRCRLLFHPVRIPSSGGSQPGVFHPATSALSPPFDPRVEAPVVALFPILVSKAAGIEAFERNFRSRA